jgi:hypothetical protein
LGTHTAERPSQIRRLAALQQHDNDEEQADYDVKDGQKNDHR